jgi:thiamine-monophosphate kinase
VHGPDFRLGWSTASDLGAKAVASNLSDIAAMGAVPTGIGVAIAAPLATPVAFLEEFASGMSAACRALSPGCGVVGGDLSVSDTLTIAVTAFGDLDGHAPVLRSGARVGDTVAVSGQLGVAGAGLWLLFSQGQSGEVGRYRNPDAELAASLRREHPGLIEAQLAPSPEIALGQLANRALASAMLDVSDGLILDARRICLASGVGMELDPAALNREAVRLREIDPIVGDAALDLVLTGGEDHVLLATFPAGVSVPHHRPGGQGHGGEGRLRAVCEGSRLGPLHRLGRPHRLTWPRPRRVPLPRELRTFVPKPEPGNPLKSATQGGVEANQRVVSP